MDMDVHVVGVGHDRQLWHTLHNFNAGWQHDFRTVESVSSGGPDGGFLAATCNSVGSGLQNFDFALQVAGVGVDHRLYHTIRHRDGSWQSVFGAVDYECKGGPQGGFLSVSSATGAVRTFHVAGIGADHQLWHTQRNGDGHWSSNFGCVNDQSHGAPAGGFVTAGSGGWGDQFHVVAADQQGRLWHTIRYGNGSWQQHFGLVPVVGAGPRKGFTSVACADGADNWHSQRHLHTVAVGDGQLWHTIRYSDGTWQEPFGKVNGQVSGAPRDGFVAVGAVGFNDPNSLYVIGVGADGVLYQAERYADGKWSKKFTPLGQKVTGGPPSGFASVGCGSARNA